MERNQNLTKNGALEKNVVDKERDIFQLNQVVADLERQLKLEKEASKTKDVKIAALTEMVGKFQSKYQILQ